MAPTEAQRCSQPRDGRSNTRSFLWVRSVASKRSASLEERTAESAAQPACKAAYAPGQLDCAAARTTGLFGGELVQATRPSNSTQTTRPASGRHSLSSKRFLAIRAVFGLRPRADWTHLKAALLHLTFKCQGSAG